MRGKNVVNALCTDTLGGREWGVSSRRLPMFSPHILSMLVNVEAVSYLPVSYQATAVEHSFLGDIS